MDISGYLAAFIGGCLSIGLTQVLYLVVTKYGISAGDVVVYKHEGRVSIGRIIAIERHELSYEGNTALLVICNGDKYYYHVVPIEEKPKVGNIIKLYEWEVLHKVGKGDGNVGEKV